MRAADPAWVEACEITGFIGECGKKISNCTDKYCLKVLVYATCELLLKHPFKYCNTVVYPIITIFSHFLEKEMKEPKIQKPASKAERMLKVSTVNIVTKTPLVNYRDYYMPIISKKLG